MADFVTGEIEEIKNTDEEKEIHWKIKNFFSLPLDLYYKCPGFKFLNVQWYLKLDPSESGTDENIALLLKTGKADSSCDVMCTFGIKTADGSMTGISSLKHTLHPQDFHLNISLIVHQFFTMSELSDRELELVPLDNLTIMCNLKLQRDDVRLAELHALSKDFEDIFTNEELCDVTLYVKEKEFKAHKVILAARSPVFAAMFKHDTSEKRTGIVNIPDCDPDSFRAFLEFLYSGKFKTEISLRCSVHLYKIADKYSVQKLRMFCIEYMQRNLKLEKFFEIIAFAEEHDSKKLLDAAQEFFNRNLRKIFETAEWRNLLENNSNLANKLLIEMSSNVEPVRKFPRLEMM